MAKDPEPSPQKPDLKSVIEGQVTLSLDEKYTLQAVCKAVSSTNGIFREGTDLFQISDKVVINYPDYHHSSQGGAIKAI